jgi:hypothetical protein
MESLQHLLGFQHHVTGWGNDAALKLAGVSDTIVMEFKGHNGVRDSLPIS